jgi:hypothetical protein
MARLREKGLKPFECQYIEPNSIYVNYGTVICPASNSIDNIFIPKNINGKYINKLLDYIGEGPYSEPNIIDTNGAEKGVLCLNIKFKDIEQYIKENTDEWEKALFSKSQELCKKYLNETSSVSFIKRRVTSDSTLDNLNLQDPDLGIQDTVLVPEFETVKPDAPGAQDFIRISKENLALEKQIYKNWNPESSAYYTEVDPLDLFNESANSFVAQPRTWLNSTQIMPLVNFSAPISDVTIEFHESDLSKEDEEKLDKYNFIIDSSKLVPIAYLNVNEKTALEQIIDFDYIFSFPFYFNYDLSTEFIKK